ncbi:neprilysin-2-like [Stegodyphus dumicola]|uniref:neprilysin-2-like n=1 Tax=Stegodyphus dumicola TaxID=202533 RepID=UPI0015AA7386|nr:neprilysin-2-like [Stegodyphus dumicola]
MWVLLLTSLLISFSGSVKSFHLPSGIDQQNVLYDYHSDFHICQTPGCVKAAADILTNLDETVEPCNDFYQFACGGWLKNHDIPEDQVSVSTFSGVQDDLDLKLKALLEKELTGKEPDFIQMIKSMYDSCMDLNSIEKVGSKPLKNALSSLGGWPVVEGEGWDEASFDWIDTLIRFRRMGYSFNSLMVLSVSVDIRNNTAHNIALDQASLGLPDRTYLMRGLDDPVTAAYFRFMVKAANKLGADELTSEAELLEAFKFETMLANISAPKEERRNIGSLYNKYTVKKLMEQVPQIDWLKYINGLMNDKIFENETLIVVNPNFITRFADLITKTNKRVVANYMMWRAVKESADELSSEWRTLIQEYSSVTSGNQQEEPRWKQCLQTFSGSLNIALSSYYVREYFKEESKDAARKMVKYIHQEFLNILEKIDWMKKETKREAIEKAFAMKPYIGYPPELLKNSYLSNLYENLKITNESYYKNSKKIRRWETDFVFSELRKPNMKGDWRDHASVAIVNAFYSPLENIIVLPAGILQHPLFNKERPNYLNFGAIGFVIGHEITHGFDDTGRQFDKDGNNVNWWDQSTDKLFRKKAQCIIEQYGNYTAENGMKLNGINTQGENIADNGGLKEAYMAYQKWVRHNGIELKLPGLKYTQNQLFWISAANAWCEKIRPEILSMYIITDTHSPSKFRVNGPMSNLPEFAEDFHCTLGSPMNPEDKCTVW